MNKKVCFSVLTSLLVTLPSLGMANGKVKIGYIGFSDTNQAVNATDLPVNYNAILPIEEKLAYDFSKNNHGTLMNGLVKDKNSEGIKLDATDDYIQVIDNKGNYALNTITLEVDAVPEKESLWYGIPLGSSGKWFLSFDSGGRLYFGIYHTDGTYSYLNVGSYTFGERIHFAGTYDGTTMRAYVNGKEVKTFVSGKPLKAVTSNINLGCWSNAMTSYGKLGDKFVGTIYEARIWSTVRSQSEIEQNMKKTLQGNEVGLVSYWRFY